MLLTQILLQVNLFLTICDDMSVDYLIILIDFLWKWYTWTKLQHLSGTIQ